MKIDYLEDKIVVSEMTDAERKKVIEMLHFCIFHFQQIEEEKIRLPDSI